MSSVTDEHTSDDLGVRWATSIPLILSAAAALLAIMAVGAALSNSGGTSSVAVGSPNSAGATAAIQLSEFAILGPTSLSAGTTLNVNNTGSTPHDLAIRNTSLATPEIGPGGSAQLDLSSLGEGSYEWFCQVAGHEGAGMVGQFTLGGADAGMDHGAGGMDMPTTADMEAAMEASLAAFPAETEGLGAQVMEPEILADGTKLYELVVDEVRWEVEPGKIVDALGYNGQVPGPTLKIDIGDSVIIRVVNNLDEEGTSLHPHGLKDHALAIDGVTFITQDPIAPGESFDYAFVADQPAVSMYHSHHMSLHQVLNGLAGSMIIGDWADIAGVEGVVDEIVMVTNDAGNLGFTLNGKSFPATTPYSYTAGDKIIVHYYNEGLMSHPMHLHNQKGTVIAKDGYLLNSPYDFDTINVAPGERYTVVYDLKTPGTWVWHCHILSHVKRADGTMFGMLTAVIIEEQVA